MIITPDSRRFDVRARGRRLERHAALVLAALLLGGGREARAMDWAIGADGGYVDMANSSKSAKAIFDGKVGGGTLGGFVRLGLGQSFFVEAHGRHFQKEGERVFVADASAPVFRLGHPLTIRLVPFYGMFGYRFLHGSRWAPYFALGAGATSYRETSDVAGLVETSTATKASGHLTAGLDYLAGPLRVGVEFGYSSVPNAIGESGVSKVYDENDVGGFSVVARIAFGSRPR